MPQVLMPALSPTMEEGKLAKWLKKAGEPVKSGDVIAEIETDKATMEVEAVDEGTLTKILVPEGTENVKVNTPIAVIGGEGEDKAAPAAQSAKDGGEQGQSARSKSVPPRADVALEKTDSAKEVTAKRAGPAPGRHPMDSGIEPEIPEGTEMIAMTVREALRQAMAE